MLEASLAVDVEVLMPEELPARRLRCIGIERQGCDLALPASTMGRRKIVERCLNVRIDRTPTSCQVLP
jgi:hypothetical protein